MGRKGREKMGKIAKVQEVTLSQLVPYANNAKMHGPAQIEKLKASIEEFGFLTPCLIDADFNLIAGHGRVMAAKELGMESVPCVFVEGLTEAQRRAYILADNRLGELGTWDMELVVSELGGLLDEDFDIDLTGFELPSEKADFDGADYGETNFNYQSQYGVIVTCASEQEQEEVYNRLSSEGYACKVVCV